MSNVLANLDALDVMSMKLIIANSIVLALLWVPARYGDWFEEYKIIVLVFMLVFLIILLLTCLLYFLETG